jgi:hypothetical protein
VAQELTGVGSLKGFFDVVVELFIGKVSCLNTTSDQVCTRMWLRFKVIDECPKSAANAVSLHRVSDLPTDRVRHVDCGTVWGVRHEANSQRPALTASGW